MKIINLEIIPEGFKYNGIISELEGLYKFEAGGDLEEEGKEIDVFLYWYAVDDYDGVGRAIFRSKINGKWCMYDLSHCSCYSPLEDLYITDWYTLDEIYQRCSDELKREFLPLIKMAKKLNY